MALKDNFLREVKIGDKVELMIGSKEIEGLVVALDLDSVRIRINSGKEPVLSLNSISYYVVSENKYETSENEAATSSSSNAAISTAPLVMFDYNSVESRGLIFETCYWHNDLNALKMNPTINERAKNSDPSGELIKKLVAYLNKISNCAKINEFDPKFGRIQQITRGVDALCEKYNDDFLYELLAIILISSGSTYKDALNKICTNRVIRLGDAVVCFNKKRYEEMAYYCSEFYANVKLTEQNFDNFLFVIPYLLKYGYNEVLRLKQEEVKNLSESRQAGFDAVYNYAKSSVALKTPIYSPAKTNGNLTDGSTQKSSVISNVLTEELKDKVERLVRNGNFSQAYKLVEKRFKEKPEDEELSELLQYVGRVRSNATKFKLPTDESFYAKALREWHIYENIPSAKTNFLNSINKRENRYFSAIMDYVELIMHTDGEKTAVETLTSYKDIIKALDSDSRIKYFEKLASLYSKGKDYENLLQSLNSLKELYQTKLKRSSKNKVLKEKNQAKVAGTIFRISQCQYMRGKYQQSIETAKEGIAGGYNLNACVTQIVSCYLSQNDYDSAREIVREYMGKESKLLRLFEKIDTLEEEYNLKNSDEEIKKTPVDVNELLVSDDNFIRYYEDNCEFEGISEEKKISKDFKDEDLRKIENEIRYASKAKPKDRADYYLTAACIEKELNGRSEKYYEFISNSMLYHGHLLLANRNYDCAKSFYLMAISNSKMTGKGERIEKDAICSYISASLKQTKTQTAGERFAFDSEIMILMQKISDLTVQDNSVLFDIIRIINESRQLKDFFVKSASQTICKTILDTIMNFVSWNQMDDQLWVKIGVKCEEAKKSCDNWHNIIQLDKYFEHEVEDAATDVKKSLLVTNIDIEYINRYLNCYKEVREYTEYTDFDNRIRVLNQGKNGMKKLIEMGHNNSTLFFENHLLPIINVTLENIDAITSRTGEDYKPELSIDVPITNIPPDNGYISLSLTIKNADNRATARNISITILGLNNEVLYNQSARSNNLKGGAETSELLRITIGTDEAFTLTIVLICEDDENKEYRFEKPISISTNVEDFENIKNPYITGKPVVNDEMFFGRDILVQRLVDAICDDRIRCIIIYGQKRTGKSSIFDHLKRKLTDKFIVLNFSVGADITSEKNFYKSVQNEFVDYLEDNDFDNDTINAFEDNMISDFIDFQRFVGKINRYVGKPNNKELLLMIDEFTHIYTYIKNPDYDIGENFMDKWKAMIEKNLFKSALIGQDFMPDFIQEYANQFQVTDPIYVSYLERKDAIDLVIKPILMKDGGSRFLEGSEEMIVDWFNGQPYYLQSYCSRLVNYINEEQKQNYITAAVAKKVRDVMLTSIQLDFFDNLVRVDETELLDVLLKIAQASDTPGSKVRVDRLQINDKRKDALEKLATRGVIDYVKAEQKCSIKIPFFHEWLRQSY